MSKQETPQIQYGINAQYLKDFSFESPLVPHLLLEKNTNTPQINIHVDISANKEKEKIYSVDLKIKVESKLQEKTMFIIELVYGGLTTIEAPQEHIEPLLLIETPRFLFPFARDIIANATRDGGFQPLLLAPIDFVALYKNKKQKEQNGAS